MSEAGRTLTIFGVDIDNLIDSERIVAPDKAMTLAADFTGELVAGLSNWGLILVTAALFLFEATKMPEKLRNIVEESGPQVQRILRFNQDVRYFMSLSAGLGLVAIILAIIPPAIMAYIQFGVLQMVVVLVGFLLINQLINSSIKMRYLRSRLNLSALVIFFIPDVVGLGIWSYWSHRSGANRVADSNHSCKPDGDKLDRVSYGGGV